MQNFCDDERGNGTSYQHFKSVYSLTKFLKYATLQYWSLFSQQRKMIQSHERSEKYNQKLFAVMELNFNTI